MSQREVAPTVHGEVSYETVECVSCGNEVAKEHTTDVIVGDITSVRTFSTIPDQYKFVNGKERGRLCEYCRPDPARYPSGRVFDTLASARALATVSLLVVALVIIGVFIL